MRCVLRGKYSRKVEFLTSKYGVKPDDKFGMTDEEWCKYGQARIFLEKCDLKPEILESVAIVCMKGEEISLSEDEKKTWKRTAEKLKKEHAKVKPLFYYLLLP